MHDTFICMADRIKHHFKKHELASNKSLARQLASVTASVTLAKLAS